MGKCAEEAEEKFDVAIYRSAINIKIGLVFDLFLHPPGAIAGELWRVWCMWLAHFPLTLPEADGCRAATRQLTFGSGSCISNERTADAN